MEDGVKRFNDVSIISVTEKSVDFNVGSLHRFAELDPHMLKSYIEEYKDKGVGHFVDNENRNIIFSMLIERLYRAVIDNEKVNIVVATLTKNVPVDYVMKVEFPKVG